MYEWTYKDIQVLKSNLHLTNRQLVSILPSKSISSIKYKCQCLGLQKKTKFCRFNDDEILNLIKNRGFNDRITGHLLGDGTLNSDISFTLRNTKKDYVVELQLFFNLITGRENKITTIPAYITSINNITTQCRESYSCTFTCSSIFRPLKETWYKEKKVVPRNIILTPLVCNRWYCDDGNLYIQKQRGIARITLHTDSFSLHDINFLISSLNKVLGIHPRKKLRYGRKNKQYTIVISGKDVLLFLDYIGLYPVKSFAYKWNLQSYTNHFANCKSCKQTFTFSGFKHYRKFCDNCK